MAIANPIATCHRSGAYEIKRGLAGGGMELHSPERMQFLISKNCSGLHVFEPARRRSFVHAAQGWARWATKHVGERGGADLAEAVAGRLDS